MNQKPTGENPLHTQLPDDMEARVEDFFKRELLKRLEDDEPDLVIMEATVEFLKVNGDLPFQESLDEVHRILDVLVAENEPLLLPHIGLDTEIDTTVKPSKKRKKVLLPDSMMSVQDVMNRIQMSENFVYGLIQKGELKAVYLSARALRVFPRSVDEYLKSRALPAK